MKTGKIDKVWVVRDPSAVSTLDDILFEATLESLILQAKGGLSIEADRGCKSTSSRPRPMLWQGSRW